MSKIDEMIKQMCPDGVQRMCISSFAEVGTGSGNRQDESINGLYPFYVRSQTVLRNNNYEFDEEAIVIPGEGGIGDIYHYVKGKYALHQRAYRIHLLNTNICTRFVYYYFTQYFKSYILGKSLNAAVSSIRKPMLLNFDIPLPPLPIQREIVTILDKFTALQANLEEELQLRQKQYETYREQLLTFEEGECEWKKLGEIGKFTRGNGLQKRDFSDEGTGCIHYGQIYTKFGFSTDKTLTFVPDELASKLTKVYPGNLVIACTSENVEDVCKSVVWLGNDTIVTGGHACVFAHNEDPKFIGYCFKTPHFENQKRLYAYGAKVIDIKTEKLASIKIPLPPLSVQQSIVDKLDRFEALIANIKEEIDLRKKQYEYYREKLLTFA